MRSYSRLKKERVRMAKLKRLYEQGQMDENEMPIEETQSQVDERETHLDGFYLVSYDTLTPPPPPAHTHKHTNMHKDTFYDTYYFKGTVPFTLNG